MRPGLFIFFISFLPCTVFTQADFLSKNPPGVRAELFAPQLFSTALNELNFVLSPDGNTVMYTIANYSLRETFYTIFLSRKMNGSWTKPFIAPFSGQFSDADPFFSPDGQKLYFISKRPVSDNGIPKEDFDIWYCNISGNNFADPLPEKSINSSGDELYPCITRNGNLYFSRETGANGYDVVVAKKNNSGFDKPESLGDAINTTGIEYDAFIAPDESYIIFTAMGRPDGFGSGDLYFSRKENGQWTPAANMGPDINSTFMDQCPFVSSDGKQFFFTSFRDNDAFSSQTSVMSS